jgi:hypothetical protein
MHVLEKAEVLDNFNGERGLLLSDYFMVQTMSNLLRL